MTKRIREVYDSGMVAHIWVHQSQPHARNGRNFEFDGPVLVSYSTTIGRMVQDKDGNRVALLSHHTYSHTTAKQIHAAEGACRNVVPLYRVDYFTRYGGPASEDHAHNVKDMLGRYADHMGKALKGAKDNMDWRMRRAESELATAKSYAEVFAVQDVTFPDHCAQVVAVVQDQARREAKRNDPKEVAKREKARESAAERIRKDYRNATGKYGPDAGYMTHAAMRRIDDVMTTDDKAARSEALAWHNSALVDLWAAGEHVSLPWGLQPTAEQQASRDAAIAERQAADIVRWRNGERVYPDRGSSAMLRLVGAVIETSWGASFPAEHGAKAYPLLARVRASGQGWQRNGHTIHLGHFQVDRIDPDGTVHAGCHVVAFAEVERMALELGLSEHASD